MSSHRDRFWDFVCLFSRHAYVLLAISITLLCFMLFAWNNQPSAGTKPIIKFNFIILSANVAVLTALIRYCRSRDL